MRKFHWFLKIGSYKGEAVILFGRPQSREDDWILEALEKKKLERKGQELLRRLGLTPERVKRHFKEMKSPESDITPA